jgi:hypothetical protein
MFRCHFNNSSSTNSIRICMSNNFRHYSASKMKGKKDFE